MRLKIVKVIYKLIQIVYSPHRVKIIEEDIIEKLNFEGMEDEMKDIVILDKDKKNKKQLIKKMFSDTHIKRNKDKRYLDTTVNKVNYFYDVYQVPNFKSNLSLCNFKVVSLLI